MFFRLINDFSFEVDLSCRNIDSFALVFFSVQTHAVVVFVLHIVFSIGVTSVNQTMFQQKPSPPAQNPNIFYLLTEEL